MPSRCTRAKTTYTRPANSNTFSGTAAIPNRVAPPLLSADDNAKRPSAASKNMLTITTAPYKSYLDGTMGRSILVWNRVR